MKKVSIILLAMGLFSCNSQKEIKSDFEVNKDEIFEVSMKANPTTGYSWKWKKDESTKIIDSVSAVYTQDKAPSNTTGVGGSEVWKFKGKASGIDTLTLEYCRSWEPNSTVETKKFVVKVK
jgi:inhibitor of cysteine peptidase